METNETTHIKIKRENLQLLVELKYYLSYKMKVNVAYDQAIRIAVETYLKNNKK
jgi:hypothetical protein